MIRLWVFLARRCRGGGSLVLPAINGRTLSGVTRRTSRVNERQGESPGQFR